MSGASFPEVLQILPKKATLSSGIEYWVEMLPGKRFSDEQIAAFGETLTHRLGGKYQIRVDAQKSMLIIETTPADTMHEAEFRVLVMLRSMLKVKLTHSAMAFHTSDPGNVDRFMMVVRIIGRHDRAQIRRLLDTLKNLPCVQEGQPMPNDARAVKLLIEGDWRKLLQGLAEEAERRGIAVCIHYR